MREIVFDTETTGLDFAADRVIEIGGIELLNHIPSGREFHCFIRPASRKVDPGAYDIHGISDDFLKDKPLFADVVEQFLEFFDGAMLIAHNAAFDIRFLNAELDRLGRPPIEQSRVIDTLPMARRKFPMAPATLDALCSRFQIDTSKRDKHGALVDSELLAQVYIELIGGRQAALLLGTDDQKSRSFNDADDLIVEIRPRPVPLPSRLDAADMARHVAFVQSLGSETLWQKYLPVEGE
ncbi:DNA polymerase III subunit epsilon [Aureimonas fodinaquatilis]|uniref:DNA polymerase III subunit epsilon n=1 Tax=Aureimonas fodinaquatilis TaxID=2565783 RepID=A0A5B0DRT3_9HYPH|nr:DNA polymerase III subunit epsilon [Aureimonas fodinaquatilis]KAA0968250.1 DNA polymerase III subunit epsilon [Aureimonas fodinaquatilis]